MSKASKMSMGMQMGGGLPSLLKDGYKHLSGLEQAILRNTEACTQLSQITRTSMGPNGMNKLVVNHLGKIIVTSDAATILRELEVEHPAAKMLVMAADMQDKEVGDGANLTATFGGELLSQAESLLRMGVHPSEVIMGYTMAAAKLQELLPELTCHTIANVRDEVELAASIKAVVASKHLGYEDLLSPLVAKACVSVMPPAPKRAYVNVESVRVAKLIGGSVTDSTVIKGVVVMRDVEGAISKAEKAKVAVFGCAMESASTETKGTIVIKSPEELKDFNKREERMMEDAVKGLADAGASVVVVGGSISEIAQHFLDKYNMLTIKILSKFELRRLCKTVGATAMVRVGPPTADELGYADKVSVQDLSSRRVVVFEQFDEESGIATVVLRGSTMNLLDDMERAITHAANAAKVLCRDGRLLPGAGASEMELAHRIHALGEATPGLEQYAVKKFAEALESVPRVLAENSGQEATDVITALYTAHNTGSASAGVDIMGAGTCDAVEKKIFDNFYTKQSAFRLSCDAALTILRVDQIIMSKQAGGPKPKAPGAPDM